MGLNKTTGNMYDFITHTWNPIKGKCEHDCVYCYVKKWGTPLSDLRLDENEMKTDLGKGNFIFVCSGTDMFADNVQRIWIERVLSKCCDYDDNKYLFQTKNPYNVLEFAGEYPKNTIIGTTLETNRLTKLISKATSSEDRACGMAQIQFPKMVTIEPIMDFDLKPFVEMIKLCNPKWVNIGADSNRGRKYELPEPTWTQIEDLICELKKFTEVKLKKNLNRLKNK